ncbi:uncharacterized protein LOC121408279 [Lytechinus variegatus]|uniref:uncharacterized protein LOC121408279 n=1 Tax=Lytechinus variegatus TaxID=7654 RepID=UPI001BB20466|nr:uncharacterized protein LOC121408279 [Lytechinus variegatus]
MLPSQVFVSTCKRKRGPNWSEKEKQVLVDEYRRHRHVLRPKGPAQSSVVEREKAWDEICAALKVVSGPYIKRDVVDVRKKWDNLCFWAKKCIAEWKDKNDIHAEGGLQAAMSGENSPPTLALKILAIYQEEWIDLFPNAQVVDGGDVFFVFNNQNDNKNTPKGPPDNSVFTIDNGGGKAKMGGGGGEDIYEVVDCDEEITEVKAETSPGPGLQEDLEAGWQPEAVPEDNHSYQDTDLETPKNQQKKPPNTSSLPHRFMQRKYTTQISSPPRNNSTSLPISASSLSPTVTSTPHPIPTSSSVGHQFMPYHLHSSIPSSMIVNQPLNTTNIPLSSSPLSKRMRYSQLAADDGHHSDMDDEKDIEQLSKELLILRKEKLVLEKQKLEIEKEKLVIERDILDMQRERQWLELEKDRLANGQIN